MTRQQEDNIMGWIIILTIILFVGSTCQASKNVNNQPPQQQEN